MYSEMEEEHRETRQPISRATVSAPRNCQSEIENGISGARERISIAQERPSTRLRRDQQQRFGRSPAGVEALTSAYTSSAGPR